MIEASIVLKPSTAAPASIGEWLLEAGPSGGNARPHELWISLFGGRPVFKSQAEVAIKELSRGVYRAVVRPRLEQQDRGILVLAKPGRDDSAG